MKTEDCYSGYWQIVIQHKDMETTAFLTGSRLYQFTVMPFDVSNAPVTFKRLSNVVLKEMQ